MSSEPLAIFDSNCVRAAKETESIELKIGASFFHVTPQAAAKLAEQLRAAVSHEPAPDGKVIEVQVGAKSDLRRKCLPDANAPRHYGRVELQCEPEVADRVFARLRELLPAVVAESGGGNVSIRESIHRPKLLPSGG